jgi:DNA-binding MarR family transcriptional regulator
MSKRATAVARPKPGSAKANPRSATAIRLGFLVWDVSRLWRVVLDRALKPLGVTRSQYSMIAFLSRRDGMTQTALAADLELTKVAVGGLLERMEAAGLVERRADQSDARVRRVYLTRKGTRISHKIRDLVDPIEAEMLAPVGDADLDTAIQALATIKAMLLELGDANGAAAPAKARRARKAPTP